MPFPTILLFDLDASGHHSEYLTHLIEYQLEHRLPIKLIALVSPIFATKHAKLTQRTSVDASVFEWKYISEEEFQQYQAENNVIKRGDFEWGLFCKYASVFQAKHGVLMYLDHLQLAILQKGNQAPCTFSGIFFRTTLTNYRPDSWKERINFIRKKWMLRGLLFSKKLTNLYCLDPYAAEYIQEKWHSNKALYLPDPVKTYPFAQEAPILLRQQLGIEPHRKVFLIFGFLDERKGIIPTLEALLQLPQKQQQDACLLLVGGWTAEEKNRFDEKLKAVEGSNHLQIVKVDYFVEPELIQQFFALSDIIMGLYQKHIGMSGIMVRSAFAHKPLLTYNYGLMGELTRRNQLGITVEPNNPEELQEKIQFLLSQSKTVGNQTMMKEFSDHHQVKFFAECIFKKNKKILS
ncbi:glycosyltransferase [Flectobacillus roseus]